MLARLFCKVLSQTALALAALFIVAPPASAHTELISTDPESGATLPSPPSDVTLTFTDQMSGEFNTMSLIVADGDPITLESRTEGNVVRARVPTEELREVMSSGPPRWKLVYRVVSADGHPVAGEVDFRAPLPARPGPRETSDDESGSTPSAGTAPNKGNDPGRTDNQTTNAPADRSDEASTTTSVFVITAIVVVTTIGFVIFAMRRRAQERPTSDE